MEFHFSPPEVEKDHALGAIDTYLVMPLGEHGRAVAGHRDQRAIVELERERIVDVHCHARVVETSKNLGRLPPGQIAQIRGRMGNLAVNLPAARHRRIAVGVGGWRHVDLGGFLQLGILFEDVIPCLSLIQAEREIRHQHADHFHLPKAAGSDDFPRGQAVGGKMPRAGDSEDNAIFLGECLELPGLGEGQCHRFFHQHMQARFERGARLLEMDIGRGGNDHRLQPRNGQNLPDCGAGHRHTKICRDLFRLVALARMHGHQLGSRMFEQRGHVRTRPPPANTNQRAADGLEQCTHGAGYRNPGAGDNIAESVCHDKLKSCLASDHSQTRIGGQSRHCGGPKRSFPKCVPSPLIIPGSLAK